MKLLALDASTEACSVALQTEQALFEYFEVCPQQHSQKLLPAVGDLLGEAGLSLSELDGIIYGQGPGSFTGVRIGVSVTQGLAFGADLKVAGVSNLALMAQQAIAELNAEIVVTAIDARMSEIYFAVYKNNNGIAEPVLEDVVCKPNDVAALLADKGITLSDATKTFAVGTGWESYKQELTAQIPVTLTEITLPNVKYGFALAAVDFENGNAKDAEFAQPNYVRDEVTWKKLPGR